MEKISLTKRCVAELVGTFFLVAAATLGPPEIVFVLVGAVLLVMVVVIGKVSGSHINPAVTTGLVVARQFPLRDGLAYIASQIVGAFLALGLGGLLGRALPETDPNVNAIWFEMLGAALLVFVVSRVVFMNAPTAASALSIGVALMVGAAIAAPSSGGVLNPAAAAALLTGDLLSGRSVAGGTYLVAPLVAGALAALLSRYLSADEQKVTL